MPSSIIQDTVKLSKTLHEEYHYSWLTGFSNIAEVLGETNDFSVSIVQKLKLYETLKERPVSK